MDIHRLTIHKMIIHKVDHLHYDAPQLADIASPVGDEVGSFLRQHIQTNRDHKYTRTAAFLPAVVGTRADVNSVFARIEADPDQFVPSSREIASLLFDSMDRRTSPGDLVICSFSENGQGGEKWIALLKMDPQDGFIGRRRDVDGQVQYVLERVPDVLPTGELQKCAFLVPGALRQERGCDLLVLDQQTARFGARRMVASFFVSGFLKCRIGLNRSDKTQAFVYGSNEWVGAKTDQWPQEDVDRFRERVTSAVRDNLVDVTEFAAAVIETQEEQEEYCEYLKEKGLTDLSFAPDPEERRRLTEYVYFEGDDGLQIRIRREAVGEGRTLSYSRDENTNSIVVTITTTNWRPRVRRGR